MQTSTLGLLIGNDYYYELIMGDRIQVQDGLYLIKSKLGWISCSKSETVMENTMFIMLQTSTLLPFEVHHLSHESTVDIFKSNKEDLWNLDMIGIKESNKMEGDGTIRQAFKDSLKRMEGMR